MLMQQEGIEKTGNVNQIIVTVRAAGQGKHIHYIPSTITT